MKGNPKDQARIAAEHALAEKLMDLPVAALSRAGLVVRSYRTRVLKTSKSRPILRYDVACFDDR